MSQPEHEGFAYGQLHSLSFHELFRLLTLLTRWHRAEWERSFVTERASDCFRIRSLHPAYAAVFRPDSGDISVELTVRGRRAPRRSPERR